eukprot:TRINITY_DN19364_c0_g1_i1.p1 TRINITY_DN19364_c0_g1~~TRINITY_DN19364_c0_g1_i1.p1  ORF type:complete len:443 (+),score=107.56 TRINITY_DN19364_c0_g1_i1:196-1524(+)
MSIRPVRTMRDVVFTPLQAEAPESVRPSLILADNGTTLKTLTALEIQSIATDLSSTLCKQLKIRYGDVVAIAMGNTLEFVLGFLGAQWNGGVAFPLNPNYKRGEFTFFMEDVAARLLLVPETGNPEAEAAAHKLNIPVYSALLTDMGIRLTQRFAGDLAQRVQGGDPSYHPTPTDTALILHTSGTTGTPKGVPLTHHNMVTTIGNIRNTYELCETDRCYLVMPLFHIHGLMSALFSTLASGGAVIMPVKGKFSAQAFWKDVVGHSATWYTAVPTIHQTLLLRAAEDYPKHDPPKLRFIRSCSSSLAAATMHKVQDAFGAKVLEAYAMSEACHQMTSNPLPKHGPNKPGTVGRATNMQLAIMDTDNNQLPVGEVGEVCIRGQNVTMGYRGDRGSKANLEAFAAGWFHTGDQGFLDPDGYLTLTGRLKEPVSYTHLTLPTKRIV